MRKVLFYTLALTVLLSCSKYEEGPKISLRSKKARLNGTWVLEKKTINGIENSFDNDEIVKLIFDAVALSGEYYRKDYAYGATATSGRIIFDFYGKKNFLINYSWFVNNGGDLEVHRTGFIMYEILRLSDKEFWLKRENDPGHGYYTIYYYKKEK